MKTDISDRQDIEKLVNTFYSRVRESAELGYIFEEIAQVNWDTHLPRMYSFWASLLLDEHSFSGNPMKKHVELSRIAPMTETEFTTWLRLFFGTVDDLFEGEKAEEAKKRAESIARIMMQKIERYESFRL